MTHDLKCWPEPFDALWRGAKRHEIRRNDRDYSVGDTLILREFDISAVGGGRYTGRQLVVQVTYASRGPDWGLPAGMIVMSVERVLPP